MMLGIGGYWFKPVLNEERVQCGSLSSYLSRLLISAYEYCWLLTSEDKLLQFIPLHVAGKCDVIFLPTNYCLDGLREVLFVVVCNEISMRLPYSAVVE